MKQLQGKVSLGGVGGVPPTYTTEIGFYYYIFIPQKKVSHICFEVE